MLMIRSILLNFFVINWLSDYLVERSNFIKLEVDLISFDGIRVEKTNQLFYRSCIVRKQNFCLWEIQNNVNIMNNFCMPLGASISLNLLIKMQWNLNLNDHYLQDPPSGKSLKTSWTLPLDFQPVCFYETGVLSTLNLYQLYR